jgi:predicted nucleic acid-binding protein
MIHSWILDASPLILLHKIDFLKSMSKLSKNCLIPASVVNEIEEKNSMDDYISELSYKSKVRILKPSPINPSIAAWDLGAGESEVLSNALGRKNTGAILDDLQARRCANIFNIPIKGTLGVILWAKKEGIIDKVKPHFDNLLKEGIRIDPELMNTLLKSVGG